MTTPQTNQLPEALRRVMNFSMSETVQLTMPMSANLAKLRFPKALNDRLHHLLDKQGVEGKLSTAERKEAEGLAQMATLLSILKLGAQVKSLNS